MLSVILATSRPEALSGFIAALNAEPAVHLALEPTATAVLAAVRAAAPQLVIVDTNLPDTDPSSLVQRILLLNARVNTAVISSLPENKFHEEFEGLGVLNQLPQEPMAADAQALLVKLRRVLALGELSPST